MTSSGSNPHHQKNSPIVDTLLTDAEWQAIAATLAGVPGDHLGTVRKTIERALYLYRSSRKPNQDLMKRVAKLAKMINGIREELRDAEFNSRVEQAAFERADVNRVLGRPGIVATEELGVLTFKIRELLGQYHSVLDGLIEHRDAQKMRGRGGARDNSAWREELLLAELYCCFAEVRNAFPVTFKQPGWVERYRRPFIGACICAAIRIHSRIAKVHRKTHERALARARLVSRAADIFLQGLR